MHKTKEVFDIRLEARLKNVALVRARESLGLTAKELSKKLNISYQLHLHYENMRYYPGKERQKHICEFYQKHGIFLLEEDVFPEELRHVKPISRYVLERTILKEQLLSLYSVSPNLLPIVEGQVEEELESEERAREINRALSKLPYREEQIMRGLFGIGGEQKTDKELADQFGISTGRIHLIKGMAVRRLRHPVRSRGLAGLL